MVAWAQPLRASRPLVTYQDDCFEYVTSQTRTDMTLKAWHWVNGLETAHAPSVVIGFINGISSAAQVDSRVRLGNLGAGGYVNGA